MCWNFSTGNLPSTKAFSSMGNCLTWRFPGTPRLWLRGTRAGSWATTGSVSQDCDPPGSLGAWSQLPKRDFCPTHIYVYVYGYTVVLLLHRSSNVYRRVHVKTVEPKELTMPIINLLPLSTKAILHFLLCDNGPELCKYFSYISWSDVKLCQ